MSTETPLYKFHGGLKLTDHKDISTGHPIRKLPLPDHLYIPLQQHIGQMAEPIVKVGDQVGKGQTIARVLDYVGAPIHAPSSGSIIEIGEYPVPHPSGLSNTCIVIETDGADRWSDELPEPLPHFENLEIAELRERIRWAGIVGMGGAAFPTSVKVNPGPDKKISSLIINGAECEPYISCDDMLMREQADRVVEGIKVLMYVVGAEDCLIGIEENKPAAIAAMRDAVADTGQHNIKLVVIPTLYPSGGEKQLIKILTGKEVPSNGLPAEIGIICQNVATAAAVADAVLAGRPLISRIVTVTGAGVAQPCNLDVLLGTHADSLISQAGGYTKAARKLILGGPMMGFTLHDDQVPITKGSNCLLAASIEEAPDPGHPGPCIRCGKCADACPANLLPQQLYWYAHAKDLDKTQDYHLFDCIECGCCSYVCPAHIPLVQYYRYAKTESWTQEREKQKSDIARQRHEFRDERLERIKQERQARLRKKKEDLEKPAQGVDPKKAAIEAAMKRVASRKAKQTETSSQDSQD